MGADSGSIIALIGLAVEYGGAFATMVTTVGKLWPIFLILGGISVIADQYKKSSNEEQRTILCSFPIPLFTEIPSEPILTTRNLTRKFGDFVAVNDVSFSVLRGEIFQSARPQRCRQNDDHFHAQLPDSTDKVVTPLSTVILLTAIPTV